MHWLPNRTALDFLGEHEDTEGFYVLVGLTVGGGTFYGLDDTGCSTHGSLDDFLVSILLTLDANFGIDGCGTEPEVGIIARIGWLLVEGDARNILQELLVEFLDVLVVGNVLVEDCHLTTADTCTYVGHAVVVANGGMLVVRICIACLGGIPHDGVSIFCITADEGTTARGSDHLVAIEGDAAEGMGSKFNGQVLGTFGK